MTKGNLRKKIFTWAFTGPEGRVHNNCVMGMTAGGQS